MGEEERANVVGAELQLVALDCLGSFWRDHHTCVVPQDIEAGFGSEEGFRGLLYCCQVRKVKLQIDQLAL